MNYVGPWIRSVGKHWKRELLGGVLIGFLALFSEGSGITIPPQVYVVCVVAVLFYAMFLAWRDEYEVSETAKQREQTREALLLKETAALRFAPEITAVIVDCDRQKPDWVHLHISLAIRNQGADSAIDRWVLKVIPPQPAIPFIVTEKNLSAAPEGRPGAPGSNLLNDQEIIKRGGRRQGWLHCQGTTTQLGLSSEQLPAVKVSFRDVGGNEYSAVYPSGFEKEPFFNE